MKKIAYLEPVSAKLYAEDYQNPPAKYGLPEEVKFCERCVISNQRPSSTREYSHTKESQKTTIVFDENNICDACHVADQKREKTDWDAREKELRDLCDKHRRNDGRYDCIVPGSGGKDSFYASHILKNKYGMHPLTVTWAPHIYTDWGRKNFDAWIHAGHDNYLLTPNGRVHRLLTRLALENLFFPFQPFLFGQKGIAPKMALMFDCPLVFYGEDESEYGNAKSDATSPQRDNKYFATSDSEELFFGGVSTSDLTKYFGLCDNDLEAYLPANREVLAQKNVEVHYLGYYLKWHPQGCYYYAVEHGGFQASPERTPSTYSKYNSIDDRIDECHYWTSLIKFGLGRATNDAAQEIRSGEITREEGVALVKRFELEYPERFAEEILHYLSISEKEFPIAFKMFEKPVMDRSYLFRLADQFRSPHLWKFVEGEWHLRHAVWQEQNELDKNK